MANTIQKATGSKVAEGKANEAAKVSLNVMMSSLLDREGMRKRFDDLLGKRSPQFISSVVSLVNADANLQKAFNQAPMTVIQSALKAATYDLPIDPSLGYAYIVPFNNTVKKQDGTSEKRMEANFILGYKGMHQMALRTGAYKTINVLDIREGELVSYNRLTEEIKFSFIEDDEVRENTPVIGYAGYFKLINGTEKTIYMTVKQIQAHERRHRKGQYMNKIWNTDFDAMARKTVYRRLIGKWGLMSIDYRTTADSDTVALADAITNEDSLDNGSTIIDIPETEVVEAAENTQEEPQTDGQLEL